MSNLHLNIINPKRSKSITLFQYLPFKNLGTRPWSKAAGEQRIDDGLIEVIALDNFDLAVLQAGGHAKSVCQCKEAVVTTTKLIHMKVDGEPVLMKPSTITISLDREKAPTGKMLMNSPDRCRDKVEKELNSAAHKIQNHWRSHRGSSKHSSKD